MGKYTDVNAKSLLNAINTALNELMQHNLNSNYNNLKKKSVWDSKANNVVDATFNKILTSKSISGSISNLKDKLNKLKSAADYISKCQNLENDIKNLENRLYNSDGTINYIVQNQLNSKKISLRNYESKVDSILN